MEESREDPTQAAKEIILVCIEEIQVPRERVTSVWTAEIEEEFERSVAAKGIIKPLDVMDVDGTLWLTDGLHRLQIAERLGMPKVPCIIKKGSIEDLLIENIISNRQRGRSNPAQEADTLAFLVYQREFPLETASKQMGLSLDWAKKLLKISTLPDEVKDFLKQGKIPVTGAFYLADLPSATEQSSVAKDAAEWGYSVYQIKTRVAALLNPDKEPEQGDYTFEANGRPKQIPLRCRFCAVELPTTGAPYIWVCPECEELAAELIHGYHEALKQQQQPSPPSPPEGPPKPPEA